MKILILQENFLNIKIILAKIIPFKGYLPPSSLAEIVTCPPYDVLSSDEARAIVKNNKNSFLRVIKPEVDFSDLNELDVSLHEHASNNLKNFIADGTLVHENEECFYVYQISIGEHIQTGLIVAASVREYDDGLIKKHEYTRPEKEDDRTLHIEKTRANTGPVFLTFKSEKKFSEYLSNIKSRESDISFKSNDSSVHSLWKVRDKGFLFDLQKYFQTIDCLYIADGHHRAASASRIQKMFAGRNLSHNGNEPYNYFLASIFPHDEVKILGYNRLIKDLAGLSEEQFFNSLKSNFKIIKLTHPKHPFERNVFSMYLNGYWYYLKTKNKIIDKDSVSGLDASILQDYILGPILKVNNPRTDDRIDFVGGIKGLEELERRCHLDSKVAFALHPVLIKDLFKVSDEGKVMPPKSTWFEPKLRSGLVVRLFD